MLQSLLLFLLLNVDFELTLESRFTDQHESKRVVVSLLDTIHNCPEVIPYRSKRGASLDAHLPLGLFAGDDFYLRLA